MILKYNIEINSENVIKRLQSLINQIYKLLPSREEGADWEKPLQTILEELAGLQRLMNNNNYSEIYLSLLSKLEGLYLLVHEDDFAYYRRTIFECLGLINELQEKICLQNY